MKAKLKIISYLPINVALCKDLGRGGAPFTIGFVQDMVLTSKMCKSPNRHPLIPP